MPRGATVIPWWTAFVPAFALVLTWSLATARYGGPDEPAHVLRAASVASGELTGRPVTGLAPGYRSVEVPLPLTTGDPACYRHEAARAASCAVEAASDGERARAATSAGTYPPLYYLMVGVPVRLFGGAAGTMWYRIVAGAWCAVVLAFAARRASVLPGGALAVVCVPPAAWFLFGVVNPNSLEIALALLAWVAVAGLVTGRTSGRSAVAWFSIPAALFIAVRPIAIVTFGVMLVVVLTQRRARAHRGMMLAPPVAATVYCVVWSWVSGADFHDPRTAARVSWFGALRRAVAGTTDTLRELAGSLGWLEFSAPNAAQLLWWIVVATCAVRLLGGSTDVRLRTSWLLIAFALVVMPIVFEVAVATRVGFIWQGRYSIGLALGLVVFAISAIPHRRQLVVAVLVSMTVAEVVTFWFVLRRYMVGTDGPWLLHGATWRPPLQHALLTSLNVAAMAGLSVVALRHLAADDVERGPGAEPLDLLVAERVDALEIDR